MTKHFLRFAVLIFISVALFSSCKKTHPLNAYPDRTRVLSFTRATSSSTNPTIVYEIFSFNYDGFSRVRQITHSKNDGSANMISTLTYVNDTIYDTTRFVNQATVVQTDLFVTDKKGLITGTYEIGGTLNTLYTYEGKLMTHKVVSTGDDYTYTSYNYNLLKGTDSHDALKNTSYDYWTDKFNRPGDYLQITSFLKYGYNFYQNDKMIRSITTPFTTLTYDYVIDAYNKVTRTTAVTTDTARRTQTEVYDFQYETY